MKILEHFQTEPQVDAKFVNFLITFFTRSSELMGLLFRKSKDKFFELLKGFRPELYTKGQRIEN